MKFLKYLSCFFILLTILPIYSQNISWEKTNGPYGGYTSALHQSTTGKIYAAGRGVIYCKYSDDLQWELVLRINTSSVASTIVENSSGEVFVSFEFGTYRSSDNGVNWQLMESGIPGLTIDKLAIDEQDNFFTSAVISNSSKIFKSVDNGSSWEEVFEYVQINYDHSIIESSKNGLIIVGLYYHIFRSTDYGQSWGDITYPSLSGINNIHIMDNGEAFVTEDSYASEIWKSTDYGANWYVVSVTPSFQPISFIKSDLSYNLYLGLDEDSGFISYDLGGLYKSTDGGQTWNDLTFNLINREVLSIEFVDSDKIWIGTYGKGAQELVKSDSAWVNNNIGMTDLIIQYITFDMFNSIWVSTSRGGIFFSSDGGNSWIERSKGLLWPSGYEIKISNNNDIFLVDYIGVYRYKGNDDIWEMKLVPDPNDGTRSLGIKNNDTIFVGNTMNGIAVSYDNGETWNWAPPYYSFVNTFEVLKDGSVLAGGDKIYRTTNNGISWEFVFRYSSDVFNEVKQMNIGHLLSACSDIYYPPSLDGKLFLSTDNGQNWTSIADSINPYVYNIVPYTNERIFIGTKNGVYLSTNYGNEWQQLNDGLDNLYVHALAIDKQGYIYAGTEEGLYKSNTYIVTNVEDQQVPHSFHLSQNYPNPLNPSTTIKYSIPKLSFVTIKVFDVLGNEIATLVEEENPVGSYQIEFDATSISSGIYFYRLQAGNFVETKKMVLMK